MFFKAIIKIKFDKKWFGCHTIKRKQMFLLKICLLTDFMAFIFGFNINNLGVSC
ncbi:hypothetical protein [Moraxella lacunata]|uniref:hypothetical protein n=1 Tax=Moraxella lacunata TaxID=477 RepID=UPI003EE2BFEC